MKEKYSSVKDKNKELSQKLEEQNVFLNNNLPKKPNSSRNKLKKVTSNKPDQFYNTVNTKMHKKNNKSQFLNNDNSFS